MNLKYYQEEFQSKAMQWWRTLSINEQKAFEKKYQAVVINGLALGSYIAEMFDKEGALFPLDFYTTI